MSELVRQFHQHFRVLPANTPDLAVQAQRLRYQIYCVENAYEDPQRFPHGRESDEFDGRSAHSLVQCRTTGQYSGVVRLVLPDQRNPGVPLPFEKHCDNLRCTADLPRHSLAEISRFSISKAVRQRCAQSSSVMRVGNEVAVRTESSDGVDPRMLPYITIGLFAGIVRMSAENQITHWLAVMESALLRLLTRFGIYFQPVGPKVDYHGMRQPAIASVDDILAGIYAQRPDVWEVITQNGSVWPLRDQVGAVARA